MGPCRRSRASNSAGIRVEDAKEDLSPAVHQPPHAADRRFGLYRGGPRNGTENVSLATQETQVNVQKNWVQN